METRSPACFHCVRAEHPWNHMYVLRIQTRGNGNTLHALLLSTVLSSREDSTVPLTVSLSLHIPLSSFAFALQYGLFTTEFSHSWRQLVSFYNGPPHPDTIMAFSPFGSIMTAEPNLQPPV